MKAYKKPEFSNGGDGLVECNGLVMPADMSDELKTLNVYIDTTTTEVILTYIIYNCTVMRTAGLKLVKKIHF